MTKFHAAVAANGDITPGSAFSGFVTSALNSADYGVFHILLEDTAAFTWELWRYDATAASGARSERLYSNAGGSATLTLPAADLSCSLVAHPNSYVMSSHEYLSGRPPLVRSLASTAIGPNTEIDINSPRSLAINGTIRTDSPRSIAIGGWAGDIETTSDGFEAQAESHADPSTYNTISKAGSVALGYRAQAMAAGEVALGSANMSHMSGVPIMCDMFGVGGTFPFKAVGGWDDTLYSHVLYDMPVGLGPLYTAADPSWVIYVQGIIVARATSPADNKVVKVEWVTDGVLTQTVIMQGANNISLGLALIDGNLQATVAATAGLTLAGYLHVTKIAY